MAARNEEFRTRVGSAMEDGWRYQWRILGCHSDAIDTGTLEIVYLPSDFLRGGLEKGTKRDSLPLGLAAASTAKMDLDLGAIQSTNLYAYITDNGEIVAYDLVANTVWTLFTDEGNEALDEEDFVPTWQGVQIYYLGQDFTIDPNASDIGMSIELIHSVKVALEYTPTVAWSDWVKDHISEFGGTETGYTWTVRECLYDFAYQGASSRIYALAERKYTGEGGAEGDEAVLVKVRDCFTAAAEVAEGTYRALVRQPAAEFLLRSISAGFSVTGTPYDVRTFYEQDLTPAGDTGASLTIADLYWAVFIKPDATATVIGGLLAEGEGLLKEHADLLSLLKALTEEGPSDGTYTFTAVGGVYRAGVQWRPLWDTTSMIAEDPEMPATSAYSEISVKRGGNTISGCDAEILFTRGDDLQSHTYRAPAARGRSPYDVRIHVGTHPGYDVEENKYFIAAPSSSIDVDSGGDAELGQGGTDNRLIFGRSGYTINRFFYLQPTVTYGGPSWINATGSPSIAIRVHHHIDIDLGEVDGDYSVSADAVTLPTFSDDFAGFHPDVYEVWLGLLRDSAVACQTAADGWIVAQTIGRVFSNPDIVLLTVTVERPNAMSNRDVSSVFQIQPEKFRGGFMTWCSTHAKLIEVAENITAGKDKVTFMCRPSSL